MNNKHTTFQDNLVFSLFGAGLILMVGVIHFQSAINDFWSTPASQPVAITTNAAKPLSEISNAQQLYVQSILNQPENIYNPATDKLTPAQNILAGGTKFLVGM